MKKEKLLWFVVIFLIKVISPGMQQIWDEESKLLFSENFLH